MAPNKKPSSLTPEFEAAIKEITKKELSNYIRYSGVNNETQFEIVCNYEQTNNEIVYSGKTNSFIILGNDRNSGVGSGYGGIGRTGCAAIDLVAGLAGNFPVSSVNNESIKTSKNFSIDAARVYISQLCDLDEYFGIPQSYVEVGGIQTPIHQSLERSGVGIKADVIRLVGRENIKLVTSHGDLNSTNTPVDIGGIDLIAGYDTPDDLHVVQPMVKGNNLIEFLNILIQRIADVQGTVSTFLNKQQVINSILLYHKHQIPFTVSDQPIEFSQISEACIDLDSYISEHIASNLNLQTLKDDYFNIDKPTSIRSKFNRVN